MPAILAAIAGFVAASLVLISTRRIRERSAIARFLIPCLCAAASFVIGILLAADETHEQVERLLVKLWIVASTIWLVARMRKSTRDA